MASATSTTCENCQQPLASGALSCSSCNHLVHGALLSDLASSAEEATQRGDIDGARQSWERALELLPQGSRQYQQICSRLDALPEDTQSSGSTARKAAGLGAVALFLWKFKFAFAFLLSKGKLLLLGLTKASTFLSMFLSVGVYWTAFGWKFAVGLVLSIYVHEMGHVAALRRHGLPASAPLFIPGIGALVRLKQHPPDARVDARIGLAGPIWGLAAAIVTYLIGLAGSWPSWIATARVAAWINLFNLLPLGPLDGGRAFNALPRRQRAWATAAIATAWLASSEGLLVLLLLASGARTLAGEKTKQPDTATLLWYAALVGLLTWLSLIPVPTTGA